MRALVRGRMDDLGRVWRLGTILSQKDYLGGWTMIAIKIFWEDVKRICDEAAIEVARTGRPVRTTGFPIRHTGG